MRIAAKKKFNKKSKGYRLKMSTHKLIDKMQEILLCNQDEVITNACRNYYKEIKKNNKFQKKEL